MLIRNRRMRRPGGRGRGRRHPPGAHAGAVGAARRLHCDARSGVAPRNSLRSLRSLRSNSRDESDDEARCARRARPCAAPRPGNHPRQAPPAATNCRRFSPRALAVQQRRTPNHRRFSSRAFAVQQQRRMRAGRGAPRRRREAQGSWPARAARIVRLTRRGCPSAVSNANAASSATGPRDRASQGSRRAAPAASAKRCGLPACAFVTPISWGEVA